MFVDTSFIVDLMRERQRGDTGRATRKLQALGNLPIFASVFVLCELQAGARLARQPRDELRKVQLLAERLEVVYPDSAFPTAYGSVEAFLRQLGKPIPTMDILIGVTAQCHGMPLLTRDERHYPLIPDLILEPY